MQNHDPENYPINEKILRIKNTVCCIFAQDNDLAPIVEDLSQIEKHSEIEPTLASVINLIYAHYWRLKV